MRFAAAVTIDDVVEAKRLMSSALKAAATDPRTGLINLDIFHAPDPHKNTTEGNMQRLTQLIEQRYRNHGKKKVSMMELRQSFNELSSSMALRPLAPATFVELITFMAGGEVIDSFDSSTVTFT
uniref:DNA replication licensing factor mcm4 n=1 Tax=Lygus hesperus TaxID=30085 RepID=A0A146KTY1_LYGHE